MNRWSGKPWALQPVQLTWLLAILAVLLPACGDDGSVREVPPGELTWTTCEDDAAAATAAGTVECATLQVPLDYADPDGLEIEIAVSRLKAADESSRKGVMLVNIGGPGGAGLSIPGQYASLMFPENIRARFDIIGFDPRGVGESTPLKCLDDISPLFSLNPTVTDDFVNQERAAIGAALNAACEANSPEIYHNMGTVNAARDMESMRKALGEDKLNYLGYSYGTLLGATYADMYPERVRTMVLDGALNPESTPRDIETQGAMASERALDAMLADCGADTHCPFNDGSDLGERFIALLDRLDTTPLQVTSPAGVAFTLGSTQAYLAVDGTLTKKKNWAKLATALAEADSGWGWDLFALYMEGVGLSADGRWNTNYQPAYFAIGKASGLFSDDIAAFDGLEELAPKMGRGIIALNIMGTYLELEADREPGPMRAAGAPRILVISTTRDPSTAYEWGVALAWQLDSGVLITHEGDGHTAYNAQASACIVDTVGTYFLEGEAPERATGKTCTS